MLGGIETGQELVADPRITAVGFTGSRGGGLALVQAAAARAVPIPVYAEMSSINPVVVLPGALESDVAALAHGVRRQPHARLRPVLHQPRPALPAVRRAG